MIWWPQGPCGWNLWYHNLRGLEEHAYEVLLSGLTEGEREELGTLTGDERADRISELIDQKLELCRRRGEDSIYSSFLFLGALLGYRGDFSEAGFATLKGDGEEEPDTQMKGDQIDGSKITEQADYR